MPDKPKLKLCKDCKWVRHLFNGKLHTCHHPEIAHTAVDLVMGTVLHMYCEPLRNEYGKCRPEGKYWEAK